MKNPLSSKAFLPSILTVALLAMLAALLPGGISPAGILKFIADRFVADGDFETIDSAFYDRLRPVFLAIGLWLLAVWFLLRRARQSDPSFSFRLPLQPRSGQGSGQGPEQDTEQGSGQTWPRLAIGTAAAGVLMFLVAAGSLAAQQLDSPIYRYLLDAQTPTPTATSTPAPQVTPTIMPSPTPIPLEPAQWEEVVSLPGQLTTFGVPADGTGRLFIGNQDGIIRVVQNGELLTEPFLDIRDLVVGNPGLEQGLVGLAFHPNYAGNGQFYINYIDLNGNTVVSRFNVSETDPNRADPNSEYRLFGILQPDEIHNGGHLVFGPDGYLYIGVGDGGPQADPFRTAQSLDVMLGKILRIDVDNGVPYGIPPDNPFVGKAGLDEIYAFGMRNPWRFSFDTLTGDLYIGDVGHRNFEEIDFIPAGTAPGFNLGWSSYEGFDFYEDYQYPPVPTLPDALAPAWVHDHSGGGFCAIVGGFVYRGSAIPALGGTYIYGDYCLGNIWGLKRQENGTWTSRFLFDTGLNLTTFGTDAEGELYVVTRKGEVFKLVP